MATRKLEAAIHKIRKDVNTAKLSVETLMSAHKISKSCSHSTELNDFDLYVIRQKSYTFGAVE
jgi:hypothetical protein